MPDNRPPTFYAASYLLLRRDDEVLLLHRHNTGWMDGYWGFPAGHIEGTERVATAACREAEEEIGVAVHESDTELRHVMHRPSSSGRVYFDFFFTAAQWSGEIVNGEPDKHDEFKWFPLAALPDNTIPYLKRVLECIKKGELFSEDATT